MTDRPLIRPEPHEVTVVKTYWLCNREKHRHLTRAAAAKCIERFPTLPVQRNVVAEWTLRRMKYLRVLHMRHCMVPQATYAEVGRATDWSTAQCRTVDCHMLRACFWTLDYDTRADTSVANKAWHYIAAYWRPGETFQAFVARENRLRRERQQQRDDRWRRCLLRDHTARLDAADRKLQEELAT